MHTLFWFINFFSELNQEKIFKKAAEIFAGDSEEGFVVNSQELKGSGIGDKEEILFDDDSERFVSTIKRLKGSNHGGDEERWCGCLIDTG